MISIRNTQRTVPFDTQLYAKKAQAMLQVLEYGDFDLGIWLTTNRTIRAYNRDYRHKNKPTDILSFPYHPHLKPGERIHVQTDDDKNLGDLIISLEYVLEDAPKWGQNFIERMNILLAHGIAHLLGYDHETQEEYKVMQRVEKKLLNALKKP